MKFTYTELLLVLAILLAVSFAGWVTVYHVTERPISRITIHEDGLKLKEAARMALEGKK